MTDPKKLKPGVWAHLRVLINDVSPDGSLAHVDHSPSGWYHESCFVHVEPRPLQVEDLVRTRCEVDGCRRTGSIIAIEGNYAWLRVEPFYRPTVPLNQLERVE